MIGETNFESTPEFVPGRMIETRNGTAVDNMSIDAALLSEAKSGDRPTLRFYTWQQPTLSLGYFQSVADREQHLESDSIDCVRRASGGGAIVHDHELTYALLLPNNSLGTNRPSTHEVYRRVHDAIIAGLSDERVTARRYDKGGRCGVPSKEKCQSFLCFSRRSEHDLLVSGYKIVGSAQRRSRQALLQHGSILFRASKFAPQLPGIENLTARGINLDKLMRSITKSLSRDFRVSFADAEMISDEETKAAGRAAESKFGNLNWIHRR